MINFLKGIVAGIGNIVPGISGSALLIVLGLYEKCLTAISNLFKDFKKNFLFLFPIGLGVFVGIFSFSNIIEYCLDKFEIVTSFVFLGLLLGTIPGLFKQSKKDKFKNSYLIPFLVTFFIGISLLFLKSINILVLDTNFITLIIIGFVIAFAMVVPGISNTVLLTMLGMYTTFLNAINTFNFKILLPIGIGLVLGIFIISKILDILFEKWHGYTYYGILGFVIATIPALIKTNLVFDTELIIGTILAILAFVFTYYLSQKENKKSK